MAGLDRVVTLTVRERSTGNDPGPVLFTGKVWAELRDDTGQEFEENIGGVGRSAVTYRRNRRYRVRWRADLAAVTNPLDQINVTDPDSPADEFRGRSVSESDDRRRFLILEVER